MKKQTLAVVVSAYNEEKTLARCLTSIKDIAQEIHVVDNSSTDKTKDVALKFTKNVYTRENQLMLNINKNYGFSQASSDWILNLDADEEIPSSLAKEIQSVIQRQQNTTVGYWIKRKNIIFGKWIENGFWWPDKQLRLFKRTEGKFPCRNIHEYIEINGMTSDLHEPYIHYNYDTISQYLTKLERCTTSDSLILIDTGYPIYWYDAIRFPLSDFFKTYFLQLGYRDGLHGLVLSILQAFYSFIVFSKVWEHNAFPQQSISLEQFSKEVHHQGRDMRYWITSSHIRASTSPLKIFLYKIKRKLGL